jgi:hypothetical protein
VTLPGVSVLDAAFVLSVAASAILTGNVISAALTLGITACWFALTAYLTDRRTPPEAAK